MANETTNGAPPAAQLATMLSLLARPCERCAEVGKLLDKLEKLVNNFELLAFVPREPDSPWHDNKAQPCRGLTHRCPGCNDTGWQLTSEGKFLMWLVGSWVTHVQDDWKRGGEEIPF